MNLTEFILQRIAENEAVARTATPGPWHPDADYCTVTAEPFKSAREAYDRRDSEAECWVIPESMDSSVDKRDLVHIARHDPARVLAECEAKRRIVELHTPKHPHGNPLWPESCPSCAEVIGYDGEHDDYPCATLRALGSIHADHPDYDEAWKP